jgi:hypothetical protein
MALSHASMILSWQEHLPEAEMPPRWMWTLDGELSRHFDWVKAQRGSGNGDSGSEADSMMRNEYARERGKNAR